MQVWIVTICPEMFGSFLESPLIARGRARGDFVVHVEDIRDHVEGCFRRVDDSPYGGGAGLVIRCPAVVDTLRSIEARAGELYAVSLTPAGHPYRQADARRLAGKKNLALVCGHYEGLDERISSYVQEEISIGDYVLSGGELPAMVVADSLSRLMDGSLKAGSLLEESFDDDRLEYAQYTRPAVYEGLDVPGVLLGGDHERIRRYRRLDALRRTMEKRPDLIGRTPLTKEELLLLEAEGRDRREGQERK